MGDTRALLSSIAHYERRIAPQARSELMRLRREAEAIADPALRAQASFPLGAESWTVEGAAFLALLSPQEQRGQAARLMVAFQAMFNYIDGLGEELADDPRRDGSGLHEALSDAVRPSESRVRDYYGHGRWGEDGGYLEGLVSTCRERLHSLPSATAVVPALHRAISRCDEGQAHIHAAARRGPAELAAWALRREEVSNGKYTWWEMAVASINSLVVQALFAAAADPRTTPAAAEQVEAAYFPDVCALITLLDSLIDRGHDKTTGNFNAVSHYEDKRVAAERLSMLARRGDAQVRSLPQGRLHAVIFATIVAAYLSAPEAKAADARPVAAAVKDSLGALGSSALALMRLRRRLGAGLSDAGARRGPYDGLAAHSTGS